MRYSQTVITDDNSDDELEKLCGIIGMHWNSYEGFCKELPSGFTHQMNESGFSEYVNSKTLPNKGSDFKQAFEKGVIAYQFDNGFMLLNFECVL